MTQDRVGSPRTAAAIRREAASQIAAIAAEDGCADSSFMMPHAVTALEALECGFQSGDVVPPGAHRRCL